MKKNDFLLFFLAHHMLYGALAASPSSVKKIVLAKEAVKTPVVNSHLVAPEKTPVAQSSANIAEPEKPSPFPSKKLALNDTKDAHSVESPSTSSPYKSQTHSPVSKDRTSHKAQPHTIPTDQIVSHKKEVNKKDSSISGKKTNDLPSQEKTSPSGISGTTFLASQPVTSPQPSAHPTSASTTDPLFPQLLSQSSTKWEQFLLTPVGSVVSLLGEKVKILNKRVGSQGDSSNLSTQNDICHLSWGKPWNQQSALTLDSNGHCFYQGKPCHMELSSHKRFLTSSGSSTGHPISIWNVVFHVIKDSAQKPLSQRLLHEASSLSVSAPLNSHDSANLSSNKQSISAVPLQTTDKSLSHAQAPQAKNSAQQAHKNSAQTTDSSLEESPHTVTKALHNRVPPHSIAPSHANKSSDLLQILSVCFTNDTNHTVSLKQLNLTKTPESQQTEPSSHTLLAAKTVSSKKNMKKPTTMHLSTWPSQFILDVLSHKKGDKMTIGKHKLTVYETGMLSSGISIHKTSQGSFQCVKGNKPCQISIKNSSSYQPTSCPKGHRCWGYIISFSPEQAMVPIVLTQPLLHTEKTPSQSILSSYAASMGTHISAQQLQATLSHPNLWLPALLPSLLDEAVNGYSTFFPSRFIQGAQNALSLSFYVPPAQGIIAKDLIKTHPHGTISCQAKPRQMIGLPQFRTLKYPYSCHFSYQEQGSTMQKTLFDNASVVLNYLPSPSKKPPSSASKNIPQSTSHTVSPQNTSSYNAQEALSKLLRQFSQIENLLNAM